LSQKSLQDLDKSEDGDVNTLGMGVWRSRSPEWNANQSPKLGEIECGNVDSLLGMPELKLDNAVATNENKICFIRSRSAGAGVCMQRNKTPTEVTAAVLEGRLNATPTDDSDCLADKSVVLQISPLTSPHVSPNFSLLNSPNFNRSKNDLFQDYLPPTWDPQSKFCFPVANVPVVRLVPDNMEMFHFTDVQHIADGSNAHVFFAQLNREQVVIKMIREEVQTDPVAVHEFDVEHGILVRISHPNIIKIMGAGRNPRRFVVLEFLGGGTLGTILCSNLIKPGLSDRLFHRSTFGFYNLLSKARDLALALDYMHRKIVAGATIIHRGESSSNLLSAKF
jgi:Protein tyrosine and serine/threonine kinase